MLLDVLFADCERQRKVTEWVSDTIVPERLP